jgi:TDG/mug DNA glycosylase family protein
MPTARPSPGDLARAAGRRLPDVIAPGLRVLFCGINPSLYSAAVGHHFARPGNRFWPVLHKAGFTPRLFRPDEDGDLLRLGYGITNVAARATARAEELTPDELVAGARLLEAKLRRYQPRFLAVLGIGAYRTAFARPKAACGLASDTIGGRPVWVLPNPSGLNAAFQVPDLVTLFRALHRAASLA